MKYVIVRLNSNVRVLTPRWNHVRELNRRQLNKATQLATTSESGDNTWARRHNTKSCFQRFAFNGFVIINTTAFDYSNSPAASSHESAISSGDFYCCVVCNYRAGVASLNAGSALFPGVIIVLGVDYCPVIGVTILDAIVFTYRLYKYEVHYIIMWVRLQANVLFATLNYFTFDLM